MYLFRPLCQTLQAPPSYFGQSPSSSLHDARHNTLPEAENSGPGVRVCAVVDMTSGARCVCNGIEEWCEGVWGVGVRVCREWED